jgi:diacylglycerol kinase family enzyme
MAGAGFDSQFFSRTNPALKRRVGWLAYLPPAVEALRLPPVRFTISADGARSTVTSPLVLVANGSSVISPAWRLVPDVLPDDGWLDLLVFSASSPLAVAATLGRLATFGLHHSAYLIRTRARHIEIDAEPRLPLQLDGDVVAEMPAVIDILPKALNVISPRR